MTTFYSVVIAVAVLVTCCPLAMWFGDRAGVPAYGTNPNQKPGWTILYVLALLPAGIAAWWLILLIIIVMLD